MKEINFKVLLFFMGGTHSSLCSNKLFQSSTRMAASLSSKAPTSCPAPRPPGEKPALHTKCRGEYLARSEIRRYPVPDETVAWSVKWPEYRPTEFTAQAVLQRPPWADPELSDESFAPKWNTEDGLVNRVSFTGPYEIGPEGRPLNPMGRTGISGRGWLGKWGPNHAADPIVTRWKKEGGQVVKHAKTGKPVLQFVSIQRRDSGMWAIPGGMVDAGENMTETLKREFGEEALNSLETSKEEKTKIEDALEDLFKRGQEVYRGYVDDPRNTDHAWMETVAVNFHDEDGSSVARFPLAAGSDAGCVQWMDLGGDIHLYASHLDFVEKTCALRGAHW